MVKSIKTVYCLFIIGLGVVSCTSSNNVGSSNNSDLPDGGPCEYKISNFKAEVVEIIVTPGGIKDSIRGDKDLHTVYLRYEEDGYNGPRTLNEIYGTKFDESFITRNKIKKGMVFTGKAKEIVKGTCNPYVIWLDQHFSK